MARKKKEDSEEAPKKKFLKEITGNIPYTIRFEETGEIGFKLNESASIEHKYIALSMVAFELMSMLKALESIMPQNVKEEIEICLLVIQDTLKAASKKLKSTHGVTNPEQDREELLKILATVLKKELGVDAVKIEHISSEEDLKKLLESLKSDSIKEESKGEEKKPSKKGKRKSTPRKNNDDEIVL